MLTGLKSFPNSKWLFFPLELVYCLIVCFNIFDVSNYSSLYVHPYISFEKRYYIF